MTKTLYIGDPHAEVHVLGELTNFFKWVEKLILEEGIDKVVLLGDQYHNHAIVHLSVMKFWKETLSRICKLTRVIALVGNHDRVGYANSNANSMMLHTGDNLTVVDKSFYEDGILYIGYQHKPEDFIELCKLGTGNTVVCHQTFYGSFYENGFYAPEKDSINPDKIPQKQIISGHIHSTQEFGKVWYPGSPRWRTVSDANTDKFIWIVEHDQGQVVERKSFSTKEVCTPIYLLDDSEESKINLEDYKGDIVVNVRGTVDYVNSRKTELEKLGCKVRALPTKNFTNSIRESDGIQNSFIKFITAYKAKNGTSTDKLLEMSKRIVWK